MKPWGKKLDRTDHFYQEDSNVLYAEVDLRYRVDLFLCHLTTALSVCLSVHLPVQPPGATSSLTSAALSPLRSRWLLNLYRFCPLPLLAKA